MFRLALKEDINRISEIYENIHTYNENLGKDIGWIRNVYPTKNTAISGVDRGDMYVLLEDNTIVASAIINKIQVDVYKEGKWMYEAQDDDILVLHTLVVDPLFYHKGYGQKFVKFYEEQAKIKNCHYLRLDTNVVNIPARNMYNGLGYNEIDVVHCVFNNIPNVNLVLIEKKIM